MYKYLFRVKMVSLIYLMIDRTFAFRVIFMLILIDNEQLSSILFSLLVLASLKILLEIKERVA